MAHNSKNVQFKDNLQMMRGNGYKHAPQFTIEYCNKTSYFYAILPLLPPSLPLNVVAESLRRDAIPWQACSLLSSPMLLLLCPGCFLGAAGSRRCNRTANHRRHHTPLLLQLCSADIASTVNFSMSSVVGSRVLGKCAQC